MLGPSASCYTSHCLAPAPSRPRKAPTCKKEKKAPPKPSRCSHRICLNHTSPKPVVSCVQRVHAVLGLSVVVVKQANFVVFANSINTENLM